MTTRALIIVVVLLAAACGGGSEPQADDQAPSESVVAYFEAFGSRDPAIQADMLELSAAGSPAHRYATHQLARVEAAARTEPSEPDDLTVLADNTIDLCAMDGEVEICANFGDFITDEETGLLADFTIDGTQIADRVILGGGQPAFENEHVSVALVSAYVTTMGTNLDVVFDTTNRSSGEFFLSTTSRYVTPEGQELEPAVYVGSPDVAPGASLRQALTFADAPLGGTLTIDFYVGDLDDLVSAPIDVIEGG